MTAPAVSVVIATRDRRALLARALASVHAQRFRDFEVVVVDDGSTDGTADWLRVEHPAVTVVLSASSRGAAAARNVGVAAVRGAIVAFLDDDDAWRPAYLETQVAALARDPAVALCSTGHVEVDAAGRARRPDARPLFDYLDPRVRLLAECPVHTLSVVACRRAAFLESGGFDASLAVVHELGWSVRLVGQGGRVRHVADALVERSVPGGLVTRHRAWHAEERGLRGRWCDRLAIAPRDRRRIRTARALFFAKVGFARGDVAFALARLGEALVVSPSDGLRIAARRLVFRRPPVGAPAEAWSGL